VIPPEPDLGALLPEIRTPPPGPASRALARRLARVESRNVTHLTETWPVFWEEARGANVRDADGNVYVDLGSAFGVALLGHGAEAVQRAIESQRRRLLHGMGDIHPPTKKLELLERLAALVPWSDARTILATSGSEAVEAALKTARLASGRPGVLAFEGGYHGLTVGSLAVVDRAHFRAPFAERLYAGVAFAPYPDPVRDTEPGGAASLRAVEVLLQRGAPNGDPIGTVIVEPVQARGGARVPPKGFMAELSALAARHGALVVADEIMTGMGRCGALLASQRVGLVPDLVCVGKALGGGLPISACVGPARVMDAWPPSDGEAIHTSTFLGHPIACAAALAVLATLEAEAVAARAARLGETLLAGLRERLAGLPAVGDVRGLGLLLGVELVDPATSAPAAGAAVRLAERLLGRGLIVLPAGPEGHVLELTPPGTLTTEQADHVVDVIGNAIEEGA
jgi:4-aminobutyrate aminotransferase/(S)-3-amino-2-methylpropionate transaminase